MNDFGAFQAIELIVKSDPILSKKISAVVTEIRPGLMAPYIVLNLDEVVPDIPCFIQTVFIGCEISIHSTYRGDQELYELMLRLNKLLDGEHIKVLIDSIGLTGEGVLKLVHQSHHKNDDKRTGKLKYQIKIEIRRN